MSRFRIRQDAAVIEPAPGTILPGVPLVGRDAGPLIPQQRVHDPLSAADRSEVVLAEVIAAQRSEESTASAALPASAGDAVIDQESALTEPLIAAVDEWAQADDSLHADDDAPAIDDALLEAVVRRMPLPIHPTSAAMVRPPAPERVKLMVGVLARDFERFGKSPDREARTTASITDSSPAPIWGPWPEPHTAAWPVVVPPWGELPRSFARALPEPVTQSA
jgi:hypothetical protein